MATQYRAFDLTPGQLPPVGATGVTVSGTGEIIWVGEAGTFNETASFGTILPTDPDPIDYISSRLMSQDEIDAYLASL
jgi:hypothetical protein